LKDPAAKAQFEAAGFTVLGGPPSVAVEGLENDFKRWAPIIKQYNIKVE